ncbi:MAG: hypothetical protein QOG34_53 [Frankiaceae bacterium]|nr:hypothetical protein [Frankiaceae bacterium]
MTTPPYAELVAFVRSEGEAIVSVSRQDADAVVPTCPDWTIADLCAHVGSIYGYVAHVVSERLMSASEVRPEPTDGADMVAWVEGQLDELVTALSGCDADTPMWNWSGEPYVAAFWARRAAHETAVHRFDAQRAFGIAQPVDADLAADGLDEFIDVLLPAVVAHHKFELPTATYAFESVEHDTWRIRTGEGGAGRAAADSAADVTVRGTSSALLLAICNRVPWTSLQVEGNTELLEDWSRILTI